MDDPAIQRDIARAQDPAPERDHAERHLHQDPAMDVRQRGPGLDERGGQPQRLRGCGRIGKPLAVPHDAGQQRRGEWGVELDSELRHQSRKDLARRGGMRIDQVQIAEVVAGDVVIHVQHSGPSKPLRLLDRDPTDACERGGIADDGKVGLQGGVEGEPRRCPAGSRTSVRVGRRSRSRLRHPGATR